MLDADALIAEHVRTAALAGGGKAEHLRHYWKKVKTDDGVSYSLFFKNPHSLEDICLTDLVRQSLEDRSRPPKKYPARAASKGERLLLVDLADVHFGKLSASQETGHDYNRYIAAHRCKEGTKLLLKAAKGFNIGRVLFVCGNDVLHVDNAHKSTTSGTPQDVDGSPFCAFRSAKRAMVQSIEQCAKLADVDLVHCMSNHDWMSGWMLSQCIASEFKNHPHVHASEYSMLEMHRKYYRFGSNLIGLTHGDGTKEEKLYGHMVSEVGEHIAECQNLYWMLHHMHHKIRKKRGGDKAQLVEKDHNGMTAIIKHPTIKESRLDIEYVRSMSAPDSWHDRNGYCNRQAVEAFVFDPHEGMKARFTEWF